MVMIGPGKDYIIETRRSAFEAMGKCTGISSQTKGAS
jgi:hypothetical protein